MPSKKNRRERALLAAPIVLTTVFAPGCQSSEQVHWNPESPESPRTSATPDTTPTATVAGELTEAPKTPGGRVEAQPDGTCLYFAPPPDMTCPPTMQCNPGPPIEPVKVKCPDDKKP